MKLTASLLDSYYRQAEQIDQQAIDRFVSYSRLKSGDHFYQALRGKLRNNRNVETNIPKNRLRLVQNHISRFVNTWTNSILNQAPDVEPTPDNPREEKDRKAAELNRAVKAHIVEATDFYSIQEELVNDFITVGEAIIKINFDPNKGPLVDGEISQMLDQATGEVVLVQDRLPCGEIIFSRLESENVLRDPVAKTWLETRWVCHRHLLDKKVVSEIIKKAYKDPEEAQRKINSLSTLDDTVKVYNGIDNTFNVEEENKKVIIREFFFRPCLDYPNGLYVMTTSTELLITKELPLGIFPIEIVNFESNNGTPRGESRIKQLAPIQLEINRCISKRAEHQITLGDDKVITTAGSKISEINKYEGIRLFQVTGGTVPQILEGRSGDQFDNHLTQQIFAFDKIAELPEITDDKMMGLDPFSIFFLTSKQKAKYAKHACKFERFLVRVWKKTLQLHKELIHPKAIIPIVGSAETVNIDEYKSMDDLGFQIKLKIRTEDPESLIAKQFEINQFMQYAGANMDEADFGILAKESPFLNKSDFALKSTLKAERAQNMILKLDKGIDMSISSVDDPEYMLKRLDTRMSQPDFDIITYRQPDGQVVPTEAIQELYNYKRQEYMQLVEQNYQAKLRMDQGLIPTTGRLIPIQMYEASVNKDGSVSTKRIMLPNDSIEWVISRLQAQNVTQSSMSSYDEGTQTELANALTDQATQPGQDQMNSQYMSGLENI